MESMYQGIPSYKTALGQAGVVMESMYQGIPSYKNDISSG